VGDFLAANSTGTNRPAEKVGLRLFFQRRLFRWRSRVLKLTLEMFVFGVPIVGDPLIDGGFR